MRKKDREVSAEQAWEIVERCSYGVLAMTKPDGTPYAVPVNFAREGNCLYIHCAQTGEKTDCLNHQPQVCVTCVEGGAWVDQPALTTRYASAVMLGRVEELTDEADKVKALRLLCMRLAPEHPRSHGDFSECRGKMCIRDRFCARFDRRCAVLWSQTFALPCYHYKEFLMELSRRIMAIFP